MPLHPKYVENEFDSRVERFDASWQEGVAPDISEFLLSEEAEPRIERRVELTAELVMIDLEYRWRRAVQRSSDAKKSVDHRDETAHPIPVRPIIEDYFAAFPKLAESKLTKVIASEYRTRHRWGDRPTHDEYRQRFPDHARALSEALRSVDQRLSRSSADHLRVRCPHCHTPIDSTALDLSGEIECTSCHGQFNLVGKEPKSQRISPGGKLGSFQLVEQLGSGSFGTVWKALDQQLDRDVAIKVPHRETLDTQQTEQFLREARTAAQLNHANIVSVHEVGRDGRVVFVVCDLIDGTPLSEWMKSESLSAREVADLCETIARALDHAHQAGVIHRDLKPSNIMMDSQGHPHLTDFGLARREMGDVTVTRDGQLLGTPAYMSPEQARGEAHRADRRSDIYAAGVILYELLTGEQPFRGSMRMLLRQIVDEDAPSPRRLNSTIPQDLETICLKCLEKEPENRYHDASELAEELRRFLDGAPIKARPISMLTRCWRWSKRKPAGAAVIALLLFVAIAAPLVAINQRVAAERYRRKQYASDMKVAMQAWHAADVERVGTMLKQHLPRASQKDLRGFEWFYLWRLTQTEAATTLPFKAPAWVAFSPDGKTLAATGRGLLRLWDLENSHELQTLTAHGNLAPGVAFAPDSRMFATAGWDKKLKLWRLDSSREAVLLHEHDSSGTDVAFSPDGRYMAAVDTRNAVQLWDNEKRKVVRRFHDHKSSVQHLAFSPNGYLAAGSRRGELWMWDVETANGNQFMGHDGRVCVTFSPDGALLVSGDEGNAIKLWDVANKELVTTLLGHTNVVTAVACSPDGETLASASRDGTVKLWNIHTHEELATIRGHGGSVLDVAFSPDGQTLASAGWSDHNVKLWNVKAAITKEPFKGDRVAFTRRDGSMSTWNSDGVLKTWDTETGQLKFEFTSPEDGCVARSKEGKLVAVGHSDGTLELRDLATGESRALPKQHLRAIAQIQFSPDSRFLASLEPENDVLRRLIVWDVTSRAPLAELDVYGLSLPAFSPDWTTIAACIRAPEAEIYTVKLWDRTGKVLAAIPQEDPVFSLAFSADATILATGSWNGEIQLWNVATRDPRLPPFTGHTGIVYDIDFSPDGRRLASASRDRTVKLWDLETGEEMITLSGHRRRVQSVAFSSDGRILASASEDNVVWLWRAASSEEVRRSVW